MSNITRKQLCKCENCGNEAEMQITCSLPDEPASPVQGVDNASIKPATQKIKGTATCSNCGNEADMIIDLEED